MGVTSLHCGSMYDVLLTFLHIVVRFNCYVCDFRAGIWGLELSCKVLRPQQILVKCMPPVSQFSLAVVRTHLRCQPKKKKDSEVFHCREYAWCLVSGQRISSSCSFWYLSSEMSSSLCTKRIWISVPRLFSRMLCGYGLVPGFWLQYFRGTHGKTGWLGGRMVLRMGPHFRPLNEAIRDN